MTMDQLPPHALDAEQAVLGTVIIDAEACVPRCLNVLRDPSFFYDLRNQLLYGAILKMFNAGEPVDLVTLVVHLRNSQQLEAVGGMAYVSGLQSQNLGVSSLDYFIGIVVDKFILRKLIASCAEVSLRAYEGRDALELVAEMDQTIELIHRLAGEKVAVQTARELIHETINHVQDLNEGRVKGMSTGFIDLDKVTCGMRAPDFWIIAARPSMGKSSLSRQILDHCVVEQGITAGIFSLEESSLMYGHHLLHSRARVDNRAAQRQGLTPNDFTKLTVAASKLGASKFEICTKSDLSIGEIREVARGMKKRLNCQLFQVDYLQLASSQTRHGENREREMAQVSNGLKNMAKELDAAVLATCQLNRKGDAPGEKPKMEWLRESGQIEADADFIGALYYPDPQSNTNINLYVLKQRNGPRYVDIPLRLRKEYTRFESPAKIDDSDVPEVETELPYADQ